MPLSTEETEALFEKHNDDFLKFERVATKTSARRDLHAFNLLDALAPQAVTNIIAAAEHDQIWLDVDMDELRKILTEEYILLLTRCGVRYERRYDSLCMFV